MRYCSGIFRVSATSRIRLGVGSPQDLASSMTARQAYSAFAVILIVVPKQESNPGASPDRRPGSRSVSADFKGHLVGRGTQGGLGPLVGESIDLLELHRIHRDSG